MTLIHLIGAGPGDPGLITARGLELLRRADVVIHDHLVSSARDLTDWRHYVRSFPWLSVTAAAAIGYLVVPRRTGRMQFCDADREAIAQLQQIAGRPPEAPMGNRIRQAVVKAVAMAAMRAALGYFGQRLAQTSIRGDMDQPV